MRTGNLAAVMKTMGHRDGKTAMHYQHPELEIVRAALDYADNNSQIRCNEKRLRHLLRHIENMQSRQVVASLMFMEAIPLLAF
jgi:hypothetical protein